MLMSQRGIGYVTRGRIRRSFANVQKPDDVFRLSALILPCGLSLPPGEPSES
jgi:hypothetical protein